MYKPLQKQCFIKYVNECYAIVSPVWTHPIVTWHWPALFYYRQILLEIVAQNKKITLPKIQPRMTAWQGLIRPTLWFLGSKLWTLSFIFIIIILFYKEWFNSIRMGFSKCYTNKTNIHVYLIYKLLGGKWVWTQYHFSYSWGPTSIKC